MVDEERADRFVAITSAFTSFSVPRGETSVDSSCFAPWKSYRSVEDDEEDAAPDDISGFFLEGEGDADALPPRLFFLRALFGGGMIIDVISIYDICIFVFLRK